MAVIKEASIKEAGIEFLNLSESDFENHKDTWNCQIFRGDSWIENGFLLQTEKPRTIVTKLTKKITLTESHGMALIASEEFTKITLKFEDIVYILFGDRLRLAYEVWETHKSPLKFASYCNLIKRNDLDMIDDQFLSDITPK